MSPDAESSLRSQCGQVGTLLARAFQADGHQVVVLTRSPRSAPWRTVAWDARTIGPWVQELEADAPDTWKFSIDVATSWERAARESALTSTRLVLLRSAMIMSPDRGGIFDMLLRIVRFGLGGSVAGGRQYVSWVHEHDFIRAMYFIIERGSLDGAINIAAPNPLPDAEFMRDLRRAAHVPIGLPATRWMVELGTWALRTESELVLKSRRVVPRRLAECGFEFAYPRWADAAEELVRRRA